MYKLVLFSRSRMIRTSYSSTAHANIHQELFLSSFLLLPLLPLHIIRNIISVKRKKGGKKKKEAIVTDQTRFGDSKEEPSTSSPLPKLGGNSTTAEASGRHKLLLKHQRSCRWKNSSAAAAVDLVLTELGCEHKRLIIEVEDMLLGCHRRRCQKEPKYRKVERRAFGRGREEGQRDGSESVWRRGEI